MDNSSLILGIVITIIIVLPTLYLATAGRRKLKKSLNKFVESLKDKEIYVNDYEQIGQYIIGLDGNTGILVYKDGNEEPEIIDLKNVYNCTNNIPAESKRKNITNDLFLDFLTKDQRNSKISLKFYDSTFALDPGNEIKLIENWTKKVNDFLAKK